MQMTMHRCLNQTRFTRRALLLLFAMALSVAVSEIANAAGPNVGYFDFTGNGVNTYIADAGGVLANMTFTTTGNDTLFLNPVTASAPQFVTQFGATVPGFNLTNGMGGSAADALAQITFSPPLPNGSRLLVLDLDVPKSQERVALTHMNGVVTFLEQLESEAGEMSVFPVWDPSTGVLLSQGPSNNEECTVFDVSGVSALSVRYLRSDVSPGGQTGAHIALGVPVPEPSSLALLGCLALVDLVSGVVADRPHRIAPNDACPSARYLGHPLVRCVYDQRRSHRMVRRCKGQATCALHIDSEGSGICFSWACDVRLAIDWIKRT